MWHGGVRHLRGRKISSRHRPDKVSRRGWQRPHHVRRCHLRRSFRGCACRVCGGCSFQRFQDFQRTGQHFCRGPALPFRAGINTRDRIGTRHAGLLRTLLRIGRGNFLCRQKQPDKGGDITVAFGANRQIASQSP